MGVMRSSEAKGEASSHYKASVDIDGVAFVTEDCYFDTEGAAALRRSTEQVWAASDGAKHLMMVLDGASTVGIVEDESLCIQVQPADLHIRTGGQGKPTLVHCTKVGILPAVLVTDGRKIRMAIPVRIVPGFGVNILPECFFLQRGFSVNKQSTTVTVSTACGKAILRGKALHYKPNSCLFYVDIRLGNTTGVKPNTIAALDTTYAIANDACERELQALLPYDVAYAECYSLSKVTSKAQLPQLKLWHERLGHRNYAEVASLLGLSLPHPPPTCLTCMAAKSKRRALTGSSGIHDGIRPGYACAWDHVGPFKTKTWSVKAVFSLKVDIFRESWHRQ